MNVSPKRNNSFIIVLQSLRRSVLHLRTCFFFVIFACFAGCNTSSKSGKIVIEGNAGSGTRAVYFYTYPDTLQLYSEVKIPIDTASVHENGSFSFKVNSMHPLVFDLHDEKGQLTANLFMCPGDEIKIQFNKDRRPLIDKTTMEGKFNAYLIEFIDTFYRADRVRNEYYISTNYMNGRAFTDYIEQRKAAQVAFFERRFGGSNLKKEYSEYALNTIKYGIAVDRLMYVWKKRMKSEYVTLDPDFFSFATPQFIENSTAFNCPSYIRFLNLFIKDMYERKVDLGELRNSKSIPLNPALEKYKLAVKLLNRPFRDAVMYQIVHNELSNDKTGETGVTEKTPIDSLMKLFEDKYLL